MLHVTTEYTLKTGSTALGVLKGEVFYLNEETKRLSLLELEYLVSMLTNFKEAKKAGQSVEVYMRDKK